MRTTSFELLCCCAAWGHSEYIVLFTVFKSQVFCLTLPFEHIFVLKKETNRIPFPNLESSQKVRVVTSAGYFLFVGFCSFYFIYAFHLFT